MPLPKSPCTPSRRWMAGLSDFSMSSTLALVTPSSSASSSAKCGPLDDVGPLHVVAADDRSERLLGEGLGQDHVVVGVLELQAATRRGPTCRWCRRRSGRCHRRRVASGQLLEDHRLVGDVVVLEVVGEVELGVGAGLHADRGAVEIVDRLHAERLLHHDALAVIVVDDGEDEAELGVARHRPGGVAREHVDLARLQRGEALLGVERGVLHLGGVAEDRRGDRLAVVDVEAGPVAVGVGDCRSPAGRY